MAFHRKYEYLLALQPDIAIVPECADLPILKNAAVGFNPASAIWIGDNPRKGLGVFTFGSYRGELIARNRNNYPFIAPVEIGGPISFNLLAVWACHNKANSYKARLGPLRRSLNEYNDFLQERPAVVAGDFNDNVQWDKPKKLNNHGLNVSRLAALGLHSAYHHARSENQGEEKEPTIFWRDRKVDGPRYHIDYCFIPTSWTKSIFAVTVGRFEDWVGNGLSDHVPLVLDLNISTIDSSRVEQEAINARSSNPAKS